MAVLPSEESETDMPSPAFPIAPVPTSFCWCENIKETFPFPRLVNCATAADGSPVLFALSFLFPAELMLESRVPLEVKNLAGEVLRLGDVLDFL
jgi:hypothetical protein